jgi:hypothetical protein
MFVRGNLQRWNYRFIEIFDVVMFVQANIGIFSSLRGIPASSW